jgi:hypothetical protein
MISGCSLVDTAKKPAGMLALIPAGGVEVGGVGGGESLRLLDQQHRQVDGGGRRWGATPAD